MPSLSPPETAIEDESLQSLSTRDTSEEYTEDDDIDDDEYELAHTGIDDEDEDGDEDEDEGEDGSDEVDYLGMVLPRHTKL